jgi:FkbM family methyltransferase
VNIRRALKEIFKILNHPSNKNHKYKTFCRIIWWKVNRIFFQLPVVIDIDNKIKCICYPISSYGGQVVYYNLPEYPEMCFMKKVLSDKSVFIDVGANMGIFSLNAASKIKNGKIYAFEPVPKVFDILCQNIRINNLDKTIKASEKVVSSNNGSEKFVIEDMLEWSHISSGTSGKSLLIPSVKLDYFCRKNNIKYVDLVKIDVEGAEMKVLRGFESYLKNGRVGVLIIELNADGRLDGVDAQKTMDYIRQFNYTTYTINYDLQLEEITKADNDRTYNIIAISDKKVGTFRSDIKS